MAPAAPVESKEAALPAAYGTQKLLFLARDPHWLYAHWDLTAEQQRHYNSLSADHHLVLRVYAGTEPGQPIRDVHLHPESSHWFVHVERADTSYAAELGFYGPEREWVTITTSSPAVTPPDRASADQTVRFATVPVHLRLAQVSASVKSAVPGPPPALTAAQERALAIMVGPHLTPQEPMSSAEIGELVGRQGEQEAAVAEISQPGPAGVEAESVSSPAGPVEEGPPVFWLNVNAELVIYGATDPGASVTIGGEPVQLRSDGTFSCRFSLPDGVHTVTVSALSAEGELRQAELQFSRQTAYHGVVALAPQDPSLQPPPAEHP
jgi:uncharacterized protein